VAPEQLATYRQAAQLLLAEAAGARVWPRHVDMAVRKQEAVGADVQMLATLHKVGDAFMQYQTEVASAEAAPAVRGARPNLPAVASVPHTEAEPGFAPPAADINPPLPAPGFVGGDYSEAARAIGHYVTALLVNIGGGIVFGLLGIGFAIARADLTVVASMTPYLTIFSTVSVAWQAWAMFRYAHHAPGITDSAGAARTAGVIIIISGAISVLHGISGSTAERGGTSLLGILNQILGLLSILLVVSVVRKIARAFGDFRLEARGQRVNTLVGLTFGGCVALAIAFWAGGPLAIVLLLGVVGTIIAAFVLYIMLLFGAKRLLANAVHV
jgi:hypothetical protein